MSAEDGSGPARAPRIMVVADLHLDQWKHAGIDPLDHLGQEEWDALDALIVAGDLSNAALRKWPRFLGRLTQKVAPGRIHIMPGNHDYYDLSIDADDRLAELCARHGVGFVQEAERTIAGETFLCTTLWTDLALPADPATMDDFRRIAGPDGVALRIEHLRAVHRRQLAWLDARLGACAGRATVITHHLPHPSLVPAAYRNPGGFASDLGWLIRRHRPRAWLFGHAHAAGDAMIEGVMCRNVSLGPPVFRGTDAGARLRALIS